MTALANTGFWSSETMREKIPAEDLIEPFNESRITNCSYELALGSEVFVTGQNDDLKQTLENGSQVKIPPGQFANLLTLETVTIPADSLGLLSAKFKWKQRGLVNVSGFHVDPGYSGRLVFAVYNAGPEPVIMDYGEPLFLLWFTYLDSETEDTYKHKPRNEITSGDVNILQGDVASPQALAVRVAALERTLSWSQRVLWMIIGGLIAIVLGLVISLISAQIQGSSGNDPTPITETTATVTSAGP